jgi:hypothetical protein
MRGSFAVAGSPYPLAHGYASAMSDDYQQNAHHDDDEVLHHVLREVRTGRPLHEVLGDDFVTDRDEPGARDRVLDHPEVSAAVGDEIIAELRRLSAEAAAAGAGPAKGEDGEGASDELLNEMRRVQGEG